MTHGAGGLMTKVTMVAVAAALLIPAARADAAFDPTFRAYSQLLQQVVHGSRVDYQSLKAERSALEAVVRSFDDPETHTEASWPAARRMAFWINAYNAFTLKAVVDHYPIRARRFSLAPKNSIRQIRGVWTTLTWRAAGRSVTLDDIEHDILRRTFGEPRIHFAINCASMSCPPIAADPYVADSLDAQLDLAARRYLAGPSGLQVVDGVLHVSSILNWYNDDFVPTFAPMVPTGQPADVRAVLGIVARFGPAPAAELARGGATTVVYQPYDWSLNDVDSLEHKYR